MYSEQSYAELYSKFRLPLIRFINSIVSDEHASEDIFQETMVKVARNIDKIEDLNSPRTTGFIYVVARNCALTYISSSKKCLTCELNTAVIHHLNSLTISEDFYKKQRYDLFDDAFLRLKPSDAEVLILKYSCDMRDSHIAEILGVKTNTVRKRLKKAKKNLAAQCKKVQREF